MSGITGKGLGMGSDFYCGSAGSLGKAVFEGYLGIKIKKGSLSLEPRLGRVNAKVHVYRPANGREIYFRSPDGKKIYAASFAEDGSGLQIGRPKVIVEGNFVSGGPFGRNYDLSHDGQRFLIWMRPEAASTTPVAHYNVVLNWFKELKEKFRKP